MNESPPSVTSVPECRWNLGPHREGLESERTLVRRSGLGLKHLGDQLHN